MLYTGFRDFDKITSGLNGSDLIVLASRPSMGKTSFALDVVRNVAIEQGIPVLVFALELDKEQVAKRILYSYSEYPENNPEIISTDDWKRLFSCSVTFSVSPIHIDDTPSLSVKEISQRALEISWNLRKERIGLIIVDYIELIRDCIDNAGTFLVLTALKKLATDLDIPVLALAQLSRQVEKRPDKRPGLDDFFHKQSIESTADIVVFLYREEVYYRNRVETQGKADLIIRKNRNGPLGIVPLRFVQEYGSFADDILNSKK